ncbi:cation:proton antiporter [Bacillus daqingensis]|uniref:Cation:proton antiporter n=2 Tax=Bacillus daqingensis TaxID=872396 RepID=A0ABV9NUP5_9BACI
MMLEDVALFVSLLMIGYLVYTLDRNKQAFPAPPVLVLIGLLLSFLPFYSEVPITASFIYHILLPALLFVGAYRFPVQQFFRYRRFILLLSTAGIVAAVFLTAAAFFAVSLPFMTISFIAALLIAAVLIPTDPVSVIEILSSDLDDELVTSVVEGESMINDGTSIVVFSLVFSWYVQSPPTFLEGTSQLLVTSLGGTAIGAAFGWLFSLALHYTHERSYQIMLSIIIAYASFIAAEAVHASGVLAVVTAGLFLSHRIKASSRESHLRESLDGFWEIIELSILSLLFLLIGIAAGPSLWNSYWHVIILFFLFMVVLRWIVVELIMRATPSIHKPTFSERFLVSISGVKGAVSVYLILTIQESAADQAELIAAVAFSVVFLSLLLQSLAIHPAARFIRFLGRS